MADDGTRRTNLNGDDMRGALAPLQRGQILGPAEARRNPLRDHWNLRRERIAAEIARNRQGDYTVPTWVLALILAVLVGGIAAFIVFG